jgi:MoaA/NifB/PqqE/SkfB family radical SAM enzyme
MTTDQRAAGAKRLIDPDPRAPAPRKLYIEPTVRCNLACRTCIRNAWDEPGGDMAAETFAAVLSAIAAMPAPPLVMFGGFGEPLTHPAIVDMVAGVKSRGCRAELITNGVLLSANRSRALIAAGLDRLWVSLDGARPESYADVRLGAELPGVLANIHEFSRRRPLRRPRRPEIGIAFVAMRRNVADLPQLMSLGRALGVASYLVTNLLPYTLDMKDEILYARALSDIAYLPSPWMPLVDLPKMDIDEVSGPVLYQVMRSLHNVAYAGHNLGAANNRCPFIDAGAMVVGWDGQVSPCLPLLHGHTSYLHNRPRTSRPYIVGQLPYEDLADCWNAAAHVAFRDRVAAFSFPPCTFCGGCDYSLTTDEDCFGNPFPTCGGCLWAQGIIRCP